MSFIDRSLDLWADAQLRKLDGKCCNCGCSGLTDEENWIDDDFIGRALICYRCANEE